MAKTARQKARTAGKIVEDNREALTYLALIAGAFYFFNKAFSGIMKAITNPNQKQEIDYNESLQREVNDYVKKGLTPSYTQEQYLVKADAIYQKFNTGGGWTEDEAGIAAIITTMQNDLDVALLIKAFGFKRFYFTTQTANLPAWVTKYFTGRDKKYIEQININFENKGIKYRF